MLTTKKAFNEFKQEMQNKIKVMEYDIKEHETNIDVINDTMEYDTTQERLEELENFMEDMTMFDFQDMEYNVSYVTNELEDVKSDIEDLQEENEELKEEIKALKSMIQTLVKTVKTLQGE